MEFEADPLQYMITREFAHAETLAEISDEVSMICNLQNIKHGLKTDYSDKQILDTVLLKMDFTDRLIEQHLSPLAAKSEEAYLPRDPASFRKTIESEFKFKSPYTQFFLIEALKKGDVKNMWDEI